MEWLSVTWSVLFEFKCQKYFYVWSQHVDVYKKSKGLQKNVFGWWNVSKGGILATLTKQVPLNILPHAKTCLF